MKRFLLIGATALMLSGCQSDGTPPSGDILGGVCQGGTVALSVSTGLKSSFSDNLVASIDEAAGYVNQFCSSTDVPTVNQAVIALIAIAISKFIPAPSPTFRAPESMSEVVNWPPIRDGWNMAYAAWKAA